MRKLFAVAVLIAFTAPSAYAAEASADCQRELDVSLYGGSLQPSQVGSDKISFGEAVTLKWPVKKISLDAKDASIVRLAELLGAQTGIKFIVKEGIPADLKITIHVSGMGVRQFLDTLSAATGLAYTAESRLEVDAEAQSGPDAHGPKTTDTGERVIIRENDNGEIEVTAHNPYIQRIIAVRSRVARPVTHVIISSLAAEGVIVNMGKASLSLKDADPIEAVTRLIKQIDGAGYVVIKLEDYLALQDPERAAEVEKAVEKVDRPKISLRLRDADIVAALAQLAEKGQFYITVPKPGIPNFLIIPDVKVVDEKVLPPLQQVSGTPSIRRTIDVRMTPGTAGGYAVPIGPSDRLER